MRSYTLDWNCVIAVESSESHGSCVLELVEKHRAGDIDVAITTVSAAENLAGSRVFPASAKEFNRRIANLGWGDLPLELGPAVISLSYIGMSKIVSSSFTDEINKIWSILAPNVQRALPKGLSQEELWSKKYSKWRNAWCDVHTLWTHISSGRDVFISLNTNDFQRNAIELRKVGLNQVQTPCEAVAQ